MCGVAADREKGAPSQRHKCFAKPSRYMQKQVKQHIKSSVARRLLIMFPTVPCFRWGGLPSNRTAALQGREPPAAYPCKHSQKGMKITAKPIPLMTAARTLRSARLAPRALSCSCNLYLCTWFQLK